MNSDAEELIPFHVLVQPDATESSENASFPQFNRLPTELQIRIIALCPTPTLFRLMHVSSTLRIEAAKLFWANPDTYYHVESEWLFGGGYPGDTYFELSFGTFVQNIELEYSNESNDRVIPLQQEESPSPQDSLLQGFWSTLRRRFPRARKVIINKNWARRFREPDSEINNFLQILASACPPDIDVSVSIREDTMPTLENADTTLPRDLWKRSLHRCMPDGNWTVVTPYPNRAVIFMPMKRFHGPVGEYQKIWHVGARLHLQLITYWYIIIEEIDRYHFGKGRLELFKCPEARCDIYFESAGQWTLHTVRIHGLTSMLDDVVQERRLSMLPSEVKERLERHKDCIMRKDDELVKEIGRIQHEWNNEGPEKRSEVESRWMDQLENDEAWATGTEARSSEVWRKFTQEMERYSLNGWIARLQG